MLDGTDPNLLREWFAYYELNPFGEERADLRNALLCVTVAQAMGMKKKGGGELSMKDFMLEFGEKAKPALHDPFTFLDILKKKHGNNSNTLNKRNG